MVPCPTSQYQSELYHCLVVECVISCNVLISSFNLLSIQFVLVPEPIPKVLEKFLRYIMLQERKACLPHLSFYSMPRQQRSRGCSAATGAQRPGRPRRERRAPPRADEPVTYAIDVRRGTPGQPESSANSSHQMMAIDDIGGAGSEVEAARVIGK